MVACFPRIAAAQKEAEQTIIRHLLYGCGYGFLIGIQFTMISLSLLLEDYFFSKQNQCYCLDGVIGTFDRTNLHRSDCSSKRVIFESSAIQKLYGSILLHIERNAYSPTFLRVEYRMDLITLYTLQASVR